MTIRLHLNYFRCWEKRTFTFSEKGVILLSGISGKGKSTILNAILWCVTGSMKNISTVGKEATSVILEMDNMVITRSKKPSRLTVKREDVVYEDDEAQAIVDRIVGKEFKNISYIDQDNQYSFVYLSPQDKMTFLRDLLLREYNIEGLKEKVKARMEEAKKEVIKEDATQSATTSFMNTIKQRENNLVVQKRVITEKNVKATLETMISNVETAEKNKKTIAAKINTIEREYKTYLSAQRLMEERSCYGNETDIKDELAQLEDQHQQYKKMCMDRETYEKYIHHRERLKEATHDRDGIPIESIRKKISILQSIASIQKMIPSLSDDEYDKLKEERERLKRQRDLVAASLTMYTCPSCDSKLILQGGELHVTHIVSDSGKKTTSADLAKAERDVQDAEKKCTAYESKIDTYNDYIEKIENLTSEYTQLEQDASKTLSFFRDIEQKYQVLSHTITTIQRYMNPTEPTLPEAIEPVDVDHMASLRETCKQIQRIERALKENASFDSTIDPNKLDVLREKQKECEDKIKVYTTYIQQLHEWTRINEEQKSYIEWQEKAQRSRDKIEYYTDEVKCCERLSKYIKESETQSLIEFISALNRHASVYIGHFFPDEDIKIELTTSKELKSGKDKVGLFFDVSYRTLKGDLEFLSGGQKDRVNLAFTLAFSELVSNRLLLLDECISSLDSETSATVIDTLREKSTHKLVLCVAHQVTAGSFDEVIDI